MYRNLEKHEVIPDSVSHNDFLPNTLKNSPVKKAFSHSTVTSKFGLRKASVEAWERQQEIAAKSQYLRKGKLDISDLESQLYKSYKQWDANASETT